MARSAQARADALDALIVQIEANPAASYSIEGRSLSYHDLPRLYAELRKLEFQASRESTGGFRLAKQGRPLP